jgi:hypothetical protein
MHNSEVIIKLSHINNRCRVRVNVLTAAPSGRSRTSSETGLYTELLQCACPVSLPFKKIEFIGQRMSSPRCMTKYIFTMTKTCYTYYYNRPVQKCSFSDPRRALVYGRFLGILFILSFCHRQFFLFK